MYSVELSQKARKFLDSLDKHLSNRIEERLKNLAENTMPSNSKFLSQHKKEKKLK